jgi:hypothetical protein
LLRLWHPRHLRTHRRRQRFVSYFIMPTMNKTGYHVPDEHPCGMAPITPAMKRCVGVPADDTHTMHFTVFTPW